MKSTRRGSFSVHRSEKNPRFQRQLDKRPLSPVQKMFKFSDSSNAILRDFRAGSLFFAGNLTQSFFLWYTTIHKSVKGGEPDGRPGRLRAAERSGGESHLSCLRRQNPGRHPIRYCSDQLPAFLQKMQTDNRCEIWREPEPESLSHVCAGNGASVMLGFFFFADEPERAGKPAETNSEI